MKLLIFVPTILIAAFFAQAREKKFIACEESKPILVRVPLSKVTVLNFPVHPKEIVPGEAGFDFKTIKNDLIIKSLSHSSTNLFVYLENRRCFFHLLPSSNGDEILFIRDPKEKTVEVKFK